MALKSLIFDKKGNAWLNRMKRYALSGILVPSQENTVIPVPAAIGSNPGMSPLVPIQGPQDAFTEVYSFSGSDGSVETGFGVINRGIGTITIAGGSTSVVTGQGTKFLSQLQPGGIILYLQDGGPVTGVVTQVFSNTSAEIAAADFGLPVGIPFFFYTPNTLSADSDLTVKIQDLAWRRYLMNRDVPAAHVFGSNRKPLFLKESILLDTNQTLLYQFLNYSNAPASFAPIAEGRKWQYEAVKYPDVYKFLAGLRERKMYLQPYWLTLDDRFVTVPNAAGSQVNGRFTCTGDITLVLFNVYASAPGSNNSNVAQKVNVEFQDPKTDRSMQNSPINLACISGTSENPYRLPTPWIVEPQTQIKAKFTSLGLIGDVLNVSMTFHGVAIYTGSSFRGSTLTNRHLIDEAAKMYAAMSTPQIIPAAQGR